MTSVQCTYFFERKVPGIANYNIDKTAPTKMFEKERVWALVLLTDLVWTNNIVVSPPIIIKA